MVDWHKSMQQTFEYYIVDPNTWTDGKKLDNVKSSSIVRDSEVDTLGSATIDIAESPGECYIRIYLVVVQDGLTTRHPLATILVQTPRYDYNGKVQETSVDAYTPLIELSENPPPFGYSLLKDTNIMDMAHQIVREQARAPVVKTFHDKNLFYDFVANADDTWLTYTKDLIANAKFNFAIDEMGRIMFAPEQDTASLQPVWTYNDDDISILYPEISIDQDLFKIPNVIEVIYSTGTEYYRAIAINDDENSPTSTVSRGRIIKRRVVNPNMNGDPRESQIQEYADKLLRELSTVRCTLSYTHGYCPVRIGDCVRINYAKAGLTDVKAKVIYQSIKCEPGCPVTEKAVATVKLWR